MAVDIRSRKSWGARYSDGDISLSGLAVEVFAHHSVTAQLSPTASIAAEEAQMRLLEATGHARFATSAAPNFGISYNVVVFPSGRAYQGVSFNRRGAHTDGRNSTVRSICFAGNYETNQPTAAQLATASAIYREGKGKWWTSSAPLRGHRDLKPTACPGRHVYSRLGDIAAGRITTTPTQEVPDMDATQAKQLSDIHNVLMRKLPDGSGATTPDQIWARTLDVSRRTLVAVIAEQATPATAEVDVDASAVADALIERLSPSIAKDVADVLAARLAL